MRRVPSKHRNTPIARERDRGTLSRLGLLLICGLALASGFVYAGVQHFDALKLGYETEKLRGDLEKARQEQRRLASQREAAASPVRLERAARQLGMQPMMPAQIDPLRRPTNLTAPTASAESQRLSTPAAKKTSSPASKQPVAPALKPTSMKIQEKVKTSKPGSDQKEPR